MKKTLLTTFTLTIILSGAICFAGCAPNIQKEIDNIRFEVGSQYLASINGNTHSFYETYAVMIFNNSQNTKVFFPSDFSIECRNENILMEGRYFRLEEDWTSFEYLQLKPNEYAEIEICFSNYSDDSTEAYMKYFNTYIAQVK